jgi:hypothetical protein
LGLAINPAKSSFAPFNLTEQQRHVAAIIIGYKMQSLPIIYLGMPLTATKPSKELFIPLVEKIERRLQKWQRKLISKGGRSQLVASVLSTVPIYFMMYFQLRKWVIKRLDKIRRDLLWVKNTKMPRGVHFINWQTICIPKE